MRCPGAQNLRLTATVAVPCLWLLLISFFGPCGFQADFVRFPLSVNELYLVTVKILLITLGRGT